MSETGEVALLQRFKDNSSWGRDEDLKNCMFPLSNALNGPAAPTNNYFAAHQSPFGTSDYSSTANSFSSRSQGSSGLSSLLFNKDHSSSVRSGFGDPKNDVLMPPGMPPGGPSKGFIGPPPSSSGLSKYGGKPLHLDPSGSVLNENEFPSLVSRPPPSFPTTSGYQTSQPNPSSLSGPPPHSTSPARQAFGTFNYTNFASTRSQRSTDSQQQSEFRILNEDFPALPGAQANDNQQSNPVGEQGPSGEETGTEGQTEERSTEPKKGIQTHRDGTVTNIPGGMLSDQFGMAGLLTFLRAIESDPSIVALALGHDLTTLGLNLNAPEKNLYQNFGGPWADMPCRAQDIDYHVPEEYLTNVQIRDKLPPIKLNRSPEDLLFYLFYNYPNDLLQLASAAELYGRDWRYHKEERVWLTRASGYPLEQTGQYERGTYNVFDPSSWRKVPREMHLEYSKLEERPQMPHPLQAPPPQ